MTAPHPGLPRAPRACCLAAALLALAPPAAAATSTVERRELRAVHRSGPVRVDGLLDEAAWQDAPASSGFTQNYPDAGAPPTYDTEVRVLYDDAALYVGVRCLDPEPDALDTRLYRRDDSVDSDRIGVYIDSRLDRRTAFHFGVNAGGVQSDGTVYDDNQSSVDWDGVWTSAVAVVADGWQAELRIPLSLLRYQPGDDVRMGFNVTRRDLRHNQFSRWQHEPPGTGRLASSFGTLVGLSLPRAPLALEATPYLALRALRYPDGWEDDPLRLGDTGVDLKLGLLGNLNLVGTVNPDFGQVEVDPAVLNLSTIETYYPEKRPFFLEDRGLLQRPAGLGNEVELFYSRRVGRASRDPALGDDEELLRAAPAQRILGAAKVVGRSDGGLTLGAMQALTGESLAQVRGPLGVEEPRLAEPAASYTALRLSQSFLGNASAGLMGTALATADQGAAVAGGADAQVDWMGFRTTALGHLSALTDERRAWQDDFTRAALERDGPVGYGGTLKAERVEGELLIGGVGATYRSPNLALNDVGYMDRGDLVLADSWLQLRRLKPWGPVVRATLTLDAWSKANTAGLALARAASLLGWLDFSNNWGSYVYAEVAAAGCDDRETRTDGAVAVCEQVPDAMAQLYVITDARQQLWAQGWVAGGNTERGAWWSAGGGATWQLTSWARLDVAPTLSGSSGTIRWLYTDATPLGPEIAFAVTQKDSLNLTVRGSVLASPRLSFQLYTQLLSYRVDDGDKLRAPRVSGDRVNMRDLEPAPQVDDSYDIGLLSLRLNAVLRWEYRPGSILWLVYTTALARDDGVPGAPLERQVSALDVADGEHVVMLKLSYRLGP